VNVLRSLVLVPLAALLVAACGVGLCKAFGWNLHPRDLLLAAIAVTLAGELAALPQLLAFDQSAASLAQAGLIGTVIHLLVTMAVAGVVYLAFHADLAFTFWLAAFYWVTLGALAAGFIRSLRVAANQAKAVARAARGNSASASPAGGQER